MPRPPAPVFLGRLPREGGAIVSAGDCPETECMIARVSGRFFVDDEGNGYVLRPSEWVERWGEARPCAEPIRAALRLTFHPDVLPELAAREAARFASGLGVAVEAAIRGVSLLVGPYDEPSAVLDCYRWGAAGGSPVGPPPLATRGRPVNDDDEGEGDERSWG